MGASGDGRSHPLHCTTPLCLPAAGCAHTLAAFMRGPASKLPSLCSSSDTRLAHGMQWSPVSFSVPVVSDGVVLGTVPAEPGPCKNESKDGVANVVAHGCEKTAADGVDSLAEPGPRKANVTSEIDWDTAGNGGSENIWCDGCWEELPEYCGCGSVRLCLHCAVGSSRLAFGTDPCKADVEGDGQMAMAAALQNEMANMMRNFDRMGHMMDDFGGLGRELADIRENMVSRRDVPALVSRIRGLEGGPEIAEESDDESYYDHTGYTDHEGDDEEDDYDEESDLQDGF